MSKAPDRISTPEAGNKTNAGSSSTVSIKINSFGYKEGPPPTANAVFDMRFLKNPYWVEELRPLTGLDSPVQEYVMNQIAASEFLDSLLVMLEKLIPRLLELDVTEFSIAFGCTGGQHRSTTMAELLAKRLKALDLNIEIELSHRELASPGRSPEAPKGDAS